MRSQSRRNLHEKEVIDKIVATLKGKESNEVNTVIQFSIMEVL